MIEFNLEEISQEKLYKIENRVLNSCYTDKKKAVKQEILNQTKLPFTS